MVFRIFCLGLSIQPVMINSQRQVLQDWMEWRGLQLFLSYGLLLTNLKCQNCSFLLLGVAQTRAGILGEDDGLLQAFFLR